jgi:hypothetical protein
VVLVFVVGIAWVICNGEGNCKAEFGQWLSIVFGTFGSRATGRCLMGRQISPHNTSVLLRHRLTMGSLAAGHRSVPGCEYEIYMIMYQICLVANMKCTILPVR